MSRDELADNSDIKDLSHALVDPRHVTTGVNHQVYNFSSPMIGEPIRFLPLADVCRLSRPDSDCAPGAPFAAATAT